MQESAESLSAGNVPVRLRIVFRGTQGASTNLHESIRCGTLFPAWKERLELKLGGKPVQLRYALQQHGAHRSGSGEATWMALETQRDFDTLRRHYAHSLAHRANNPGKTLRMLVFADEACTSNRATASASQAPEASSSPAVFAESQQHTPSATSRRPPQHPHLKNFRCPPAALQPSRKMRRRRMSADTNSVPTMWPSDHSDPASAICWKLVLRSIISTVDKHHFGSKLPATQGVSNMAVRTLPPSAGGTAEH